jgi:hypothetical protein
VAEMSPLLSNVEFSSSLPWPMATGSRHMSLASYHVITSAYVSRGIQRSVAVGQTGVVTTWGTFLWFQYRPTYRAVSCNNDALGLYIGAGYES